MTKRYLKTPEEIIDALQAGKTLHNKYSKWVLYNGFIMRKDKNSDNWAINDSLCSRLDDVVYYSKDPKPLKLEVGKFYRTRGGKKVIVLYVDKNDTTGFPVFIAAVGDPDYSYYARGTGEYSNCANSAWDLVAPWEEH